MEGQGNNNNQLTQSSSTEGSNQQQGWGSCAMYYFKTVFQYFFGLTQVFFRNIKSGLMYTAIIDFAIYMYKNFKVSASTSASSR